jgi:PAS domain S-box-containing protein
VNALKAEGRVSNILTPMNTKSGERKILRMSVEVIDLGERDRILSIANDVTEEIKAQSNLTLSEERLRMAMEASNAGFWWRDHPYSKVYWSDENYRLLGYTPGEVTPSFDTWKARIHPEDYETVVNKFQSAIDNLSVINLEYRVLWQDGTVRWINNIGKLIQDDRGGTNSYCGIQIDITDLKRTQDQLLQAQKSESIGQLTGGVAHDFNNLLQVFTGAGAMIESLQGDPEQQGRWIDSIFKAVERGRSLTGQLLSFSRQQSLSPEVASPRDGIFEVEELLRRTLGEDISFMVSCPDDIPTVLVDVHGLQNAVVNLCINAAAVMPDGGSLAIDITTITVEVPVFVGQDSLEAGDYVQIAVSDTGSGMDAETLSKAFDPFFTTKEVGEGTGLGLSMVYGFAKQSGGEASIESEIGKGTTVTLVLPVSIAESEVADEVAANRIGAIQSASILVVEDDPDVRETTTAILEAIGHKVTEAPDAISALETLKGDARFDVVFSDVVMPGGMSGIELTEEIAAQPDAPKVLLTSGYPDRLKEFEDKKLGSVDIVSKPFSMDEIKAALDGLLQSG